MFFGRDKESKKLLNHVLLENLFLLFAKSGVGKTSLVKAGLMENLRRNRHFPIFIRFNDLSKSPLKIIFETMQQSASEQRVQIKADSSRPTLWHYFKTAQCWSEDNILLMPVLIFDQFEEIFTLRKKEERDLLFNEISFVIRDRKPIGDYKVISMSDISPQVKILISIREDFLAELEALSELIPKLFSNRFRLLALKKDQAKEVIEKPSQLINENIKTEPFTFSVDAVEEILRFLSQQRSGVRFIESDDIEPLHLNLICHYFELKKTAFKDYSPGNMFNRNTRKIVIRKENLGGEKGLKKVFKRFVTDQMDELSDKDQELVINLCNNGLTSKSGWRLSLDREIIIDEFGISAKLLSSLVEGMLLRKEPRLGSSYYELSHDILLEPVKSLKALSEEVLLKSASKEIYKGNNDKAINIYKSIIGKNKFFTDAYIQLSQLYHSIGKSEEAIEVLETAATTIDSNPRIYNPLGRLYQDSGDIDKAIQNFNLALSLNSDDIFAAKALEELEKKKKHFDQFIQRLEAGKDLNRNDYKGLISSYIDKKEYTKALEIYTKAIEKDEDMANLYNEFIVALNISESENDKEKIERAREVLKIALETSNSRESFFFSLGYLAGTLKEYNLSIKAFEKHLVDYPDDASAIDNWSWTLQVLGDYKGAISKSKELISIDPNYKQAYYRLGYNLGKIEKYKEAIEELSKALEIDPYYEGVLENMSWCYQKLENFKMAAEYGKKLVDINKNSVSGNTRWGYNIGRLGKYEEAIEIFQFVLQIAPNDLLAIDNWHWNLIQLEDHDKAISHANKLIELLPQSEVGYFGMAEKLGNLERYEEAIPQYEKVLEINPGNKKALENLSLYLEKTANYEEAVEVAKRLVDLDPKSGTGLFRWAFNLSYLREFKKAIKVHHNNLEINPDHTGSIDNLSYCYEQIGDHKSAISYAQKLLSLNPDSINGLFNIGYNNALLGDHTVAIEQYHKILEINPNHELTLDALIWSYERLGERKEAIATAKKLIKSNPKSHVGYYRWGYNLVKLEKYKEAKKQLKKSLSIKSDYVPSLENLGICLGELGDHKGGIEALQKGLEIEPYNSNLLGNLSWYFYCIKDYVKSINYAERALKIEPNSGYFRSNLAFSLLFTDKYEKAKMEFAKVLDLINSENWTAIEKSDGKAFLIEEMLKHLEAAKKNASQELLRYVQEIIEMIEKEK